MSLKTDIILIGGGGHCKSCIDVIEEEGSFTIRGIIDVPEKIGQTILGYPIIDCDNNLDKVVKRNKHFLITVGFVKSPKLRIKLYQQVTALGGKFPVIISPKAHVSKFATIEAGTIIMHGAIVNSDAHVGQNCIVNNQALIEHDVIIAENSHLSTGSKINGGCLVGKNCFIGSGAIINHGIRIGHNVIIGSGSVVRKDILESGIYVGNPLKKIK